jgi:hypothetical protein
MIRFFSSLTSWVHRDRLEKALRAFLHPVSEHVLSDGSFYYGEWRGGKYHGQGAFTWADGSVLVGYWIDGQVVKGKKTMADGSFYDGEWKNGKSHGKSPSEGCDGPVLVGDWIGGNVVKGKKTLADVSDKYHGRRTHHSTDSASGSNPIQSLVTCHLKF